jgi:hypothetical protein
MIQAYQLQLKGHVLDRYIIAGDKYFTIFEPPEWMSSTAIKAISGNAIIYPEHDLLWISGKMERFKNPENFEKEINALPRWEATRYAVLEAPNNYDENPDADGDFRVLDYVLFLHDCRTGESLMDDVDKPIPGRKAEVVRLRRGIEQLMRGESWSLW